MDFHKIIHLPAETRYLEAIRGFVEQHAAQTPASPKEIYELIQAVDEAATNIIVHGYRNGAGDIEVETQYKSGRITVILRDQAPPFNPTTVPEPDLEMPLHKRRAGGLGVHLIRSCVNEFTHSAIPPGGNELKLVKYLKDKG